MVYYTTETKNHQTGAARENRTLTPLRERDFESRASTNSAIAASIWWVWSQKPEKALFWLPYII